MGIKSESYDWNWLMAKRTSKLNKFQENKKDFQWWKFPGNVLSIPEAGNLICAVFCIFIGILKWSSFENHLDLFGASKKGYKL